MRAALPAALLLLVAAAAPVAAMPGLAALPEDTPVCVPDQPFCWLPEPPEPGIVCTPESMLCSPAQLLCPRLGGTFGWCASAQAQEGSAEVGASAGNWHGPRAGAAAGAAKQDPDGDGQPGAAAQALVHADACFPMVEVVLLPDAPWPAPGLACSVAADPWAGLDL